MYHCCKYCNYFFREKVYQISIQDYQSENYGILVMYQSLLSWMLTHMVNMGILNLFIPYVQQCRHGDGHFLSEHRGRILFLFLPPFHPVWQGIDFSLPFPSLLGIADHGGENPNDPQMAVNIENKPFAPSDQPIFLHSDSVTILSQKI